MSGTAEAITELNEQTEPADNAPPRPAALPYLSVRDARAAIDWYIAAFGATVVGEPYFMDDGRVGHAELQIGDGVLYLADEYPELGLRGPDPKATSVSLMLHVDDADAALERARGLGAVVQREAYENYGARNATIVDPSGHRWMLSGPATGAPTQIEQGDVGYVSVWTRDADKAAAFYGHVLGWRYDAQTNQVTNTTESIGLFSVDGPGNLFCCYAVGDLDGARQGILDGGGQVDDVQRMEFGDVLGATDPLGRPFAVYQPRPGQARPALNGTGPGELSYITHEVTDSAAFKSFYSRFLFWTFEGGRMDDGWEVVGSHPMTGIAGGSAENVTTPMWTVEDIDAAVARVVEAGGSVIEPPSQKPYGKSAQCTDDQGTRFYLGQF